MLSLNSCKKLHVLSAFFTPALCWNMIRGAAPVLDPPASCKKSVMFLSVELLLDARSVTRGELS